MTSRAMKTRAARLLFWGVVLGPALVYTAALILGQQRVLGWERAQSITLAQVVPLALAYVIYVLMGHLLFNGTTEQTSRKTIGLYLTALFVAGIGLQIAATAVVEPYPLRGILQRQYSQFSSGYFTVGARIDNAATFLADFVQNAPNYPIHPRFNPPALPLVFWFSTRVAEVLGPLSASLGPILRPLACFDEFPTPLSDGQIVGGLIGGLIEIVLATVVIFPLYSFTKRWAGQRAALLAAWLYLATACVLMWVSRFNRAYPLIVITGLWLCELLVQRLQHPGKPRFVPALLIGLLLALGLFCTVANAPMFAIIGLYLAVRMWQHRASNVLPQRYELVQWSLQLVGMAAGFVLFWAVLVIGFGYDPIGTYRASMNQHFTLDRPYWPWALFSALDIFNFIGLPLVAIAVLTMWRKQPALAAAFIVPIAILSITRLAHDETGRLLMYFAPLAVALAASYLSTQSMPIRTVVIGVTILQLFTHIALLRVISYGTEPLVVPSATLPTDLVPTNIRFERDGEIELLGYTLKPTLKPGDTADITYYWKLDSTEPLSHSYKIFTHVAPTLADETRIGNADGKPLNWALPTTCWRPGVVLRDTHSFTVDANAAPGDYLVLVGLYSEFTNERAFVNTAQRAMNNAVELPQKLAVEK